MVAVPGRDFTGTTIILGRIADEVLPPIPRRRMELASFGPNLRYCGFALRLWSNSLAVGGSTAGANGQHLYLGDIGHMFKPPDWVLVQRPEEIILNSRFLCSLCKLPSGIVCGLETACEGQARQILQCCECGQRWHAPLD